MQCSGGLIKSKWLDAACVLVAPLLLRLIVHISINLGRLERTLDSRAYAAPLIAGTIGAN